LALNRRRLRGLVRPRTPRWRFCSVTSHTPRNRKLDTISDRLYRAASNIEQAFAHLNEQRALVPAIGSSRTDGAGGSPSGHSDRTLGTMIRLDEIENKRQALHDAIGSANLAAKVIEDAIDDAYKARAEKGDTPDAPVHHDDRPLCRGGTPDTWGDPECGRHQDHYSLASGEIRFRGDGLCAMHRKRKERWERNGTIEGAA
jgi:hypothetical protein